MEKFHDLVVFENRHTCFMASRRDDKLFGHAFPVGLLEYFRTGENPDIRKSASAPRVRIVTAWLERPRTTKKINNFSRPPEGGFLNRQIAALNTHDCPGYAMFAAVKPDPRVSMAPNFKFKDF